MYRRDHSYNNAIAVIPVKTGHLSDSPRRESRTNKNWIPHQVRNDTERMDSTEVYSEGGVEMTLGKPVASKEYRV